MSEERVRHSGGDWIKIRLTALEQDVLYEFIMENEQDIDLHLQPVLSDILGKLPEQDILTRPPAAETAIEMGILDGGADEVHDDG